VAAAIALVMLQGASPPTQSPPPAASEPASPAAQGANTDIYGLLDLFGEVLGRVRTEYVEKPDDKKLIENAISGMLQGLNLPMQSLQSAASKPTLPTSQGANTDIYGLLDQFGKVLEKVRTQYVPKPDDKILIENAINGMLQGLDPHSSYITPKEFEVMPAKPRAETGAVPNPIQTRVVRDIIRLNPVKSSAEDDVGWVKIRTFQSEHT